MAIGLIVIGDEIMSGRRTDQHFANVVKILGDRGLTLGWARYLGDDPVQITALLRETFASRDIVFCCGGIGSTPDDHTRQCASEALGIPLVMHPEAYRWICERIRDTAKDPEHVDYASPDSLRRLQMGEYPEGSRIIPNPVNKIPAFSFRTHYFVPGFPQMASAMISWALDTYHRDIFNSDLHAEKSAIVYGAVEARMTPLMEDIEARFPAVKVFSLPHMGSTRQANYVEIGVKGRPDLIDEAFAALLAGIDKSGRPYKISGEE